jgi:fructose-1,6-bisphosphatase/inositol monophosphatase family enzyme
MDDLHDYYNAACRVVTRAREQLLNGLSATGPEVGVLDKGNSDFQTSLDVNIEQDIRDYLTHRFPDHSIVG